MTVLYSSVEYFPTTNSYGSSLSLSVCVSTVASSLERFSPSLSKERCLPLYMHCNYLPAGRPNIKQKAIYCIR